MSHSFASRIKSKIFQNSNSKNNVKNNTNDSQISLRKIPNKVIKKDIKTSQLWESSVEADNEYGVNHEDEELNEDKINSDYSSFVENEYIPFPQESKEEKEPNNTTNANEYIKGRNDVKIKKVNKVKSTMDPINNENATGKQSKLRLFRKKMSIPDLNFITRVNDSKGSKIDLIEEDNNITDTNLDKAYTSNSNTNTTSREIQRTLLSHNRTKSFPFNSESNNEHSFSVYRTKSNTLYTSDIRFRDSEENIIVRKVQSDTFHSNDNYAPSPTISRTNTGSSFSSHYSGGTIIRSTTRSPVGRGRSRTLDTSDFSKKNPEPQAGLPLREKKNSSTSSLTARIVSSYSGTFSNKFSRSRSNSQVQNGMSVTSTNTSSNSSTTSKHELSRTLSSHRGSNSSTHLPSMFSSSPNPSGSTRKRSGSFANAISSLVNLKTNSASSVRVLLNDECQQKSTTLADLPPVPEPALTDSYKDYLVRISQYEKYIAVILTNKDDTFKKKVLNYFLKNCFDFSDMPLDVALRELLMFLELPKETQQIDRLLLEFSRVYYQEQVTQSTFSGWYNEDQVYFIVFSLLMLHTDFYNVNNRSKMLKEEFINLVHNDIECSGNKVPTEVLSYFYDNIITKESPKFDMSNLGFGFEDKSDETVEKNSKEMSALEIYLTPSIPKLVIYSPKSIISGKLLSSGNWPPVPQINIGRSASNSLSTYLGYSSNPSSNSNNLNSIKDDIDLYSHICNNTLSEVNMEKEVIKVWDTQCVNKSFSRNNVDQCSKYFSILNDVKGDYLRINRNHFEKIAHLNYELMNEVDDPYLHLKIIHMGKINSLISSKKFTLVGSNSKANWKQEYGILTSYGLLIFDNFEWIVPKSVTDKVTNASNYIIDYCFGTSLLSESIIDCNGLLAIVSKEEVGKFSFSSILSTDTGDDMQEDLGMENSQIKLFNELLNKEDSDKLLFIHSPTKKYIWRCSDINDKNKWVNAINLVATYSHCFVEMNSIPNTVVSLMKIKITDKLEKLVISKQNNIEKLKTLQEKLSFYHLAIPMSSKTRNDLIFHIRQLAVKMDWLLYKIKRNAVYIDIARQMEPNNSKNSSYISAKKNSLIENVFLSESSLQRCITDDSSILADNSVVINTEEMLKF